MDGEVPARLGAICRRIRHIAEALGLDRFRTYSMPRIWTIPWGLVIGPVPSWPLPTKVTLQICEPMDWSHLGPDDAENPDIVDRCYRAIEARMQATLDDLAEEIPHPTVTRMRSVLRKRVG